MKLVPIILSLMIAMCCCGACAGRSVEVDPSLRYYADRSAESIAEEIGANGYEEVRLIYSIGARVDSDLIKAMSGAGIRVWISTYLNGVDKNGKVPGGMEMAQRKISRGDFTYICPANDDFHGVAKKWLIDTAQKNKIYGIDLGGAWFPGSAGPDADSYGCLCGRCTSAFRSTYRTEPPDFFTAESKRFWKKSKLSYEKWVAFRASILLEAIDGIVSGVREKCPDLKICTRSIAMDTPDGAEKIRENTGCDAAALIKRVKPDMHVLEIDRIDSFKPGLSSNYPVKCLPILNSISEVAPSTPVFIAADIGSTADNRRTAGWMEDTEKSAKAAGFKGAIWHEYSLGDYTYSAALAVLKSKIDRNSIQLVFNKRLDPMSVSNIANYTISSGRIEFARCDGCVVNLTVSNVESQVNLVISGLCDDEEHRFLHDKPACALEKPIEVTIGADN